jgi:hypothetical protein
MAGRVLVLTRPLDLGQIPLASPAMRFCALISGLFLASGLNGIAGSRTFTVVTNAAMVNHWPSSDGFIGTSDDVVSSELSTYGHSSPNQYGTYSYIVTSFGLSNQPDPLLFGSYDTATFILGSATIDPSAFLTNDVPLMTGVQFSGTELFPGHGPYSVKMTNPRSGTYTHQGSVFTFSSHFDFQGNFVAGTAVATNADANGLVVLLDPANFDSPDLAGVAADLANYIRSVAIPLAKTMNANGLLCGTVKLDTAGSVPGVPGDTGYFPPLNCYSTLLAMDLGTGQLSITSVQSTAAGTKIQWSPLSGNTYSIYATASLDTPFTLLASSLFQSQYLDPPTRLHTRFYRVSSP